MKHSHFQLAADAPLKFKEKEVHLGWTVGFWGVTLCWVFERMVGPAKPEC